MINAPLPFTAAWRVIKGFTYPITVQKVHIVAPTSVAASPTLASSCAGAAGDLRQRVNGWHAELDALLARPGHDARLLRAGYAPPADVAQLPSSASSAAHDFRVGYWRRVYTTPPNQHAFSAG